MKNEETKVEMVQFSVPRLTKKELIDLQTLLLERVHLLVESILENGEPVEETLVEIAGDVDTLKKVS